MKEEDRPKGGETLFGSGAQEDNSTVQEFLGVEFVCKP